MPTQLPTSIGPNTAPQKRAPDIEHGMSRQCQKAIGPATRNQPCPRKAETDELSQAFRWNEALFCVAAKELNLSYHNRDT